MMQEILTANTIYTVTLYMHVIQLLALDAAQLFQSVLKPLLGID